MQERALPGRVDAAAVEVVAVARRVLALGKVQRGQIAVRLDRVDARTAELVREQARDAQRDVANVLRVDAEAVLTREQPVLRILVVLGRLREPTTAGTCGS